MRSLLLIIASMVSMIASPIPASAEIRFEKDSIEEWADQFFGDEVENKRLTAAGFAVVQDGKILFSKGYGYEDYAKEIPFDPEHTRVRVCSNSKVIVATALMKLIEEGKIASLNDPANKYLKRFQLPARGGKEITIHNLLTHRAGFSVAAFNAGTLKQHTIPLPGDVYERLIPEQAEEAGKISSYANGALAVQGAIIEDITGEPITNLLQTAVFDPIGMEKSLYHYQMELPERLAVPYRFYPDGTSTALPFTPKHPAYAPSGGIISTTNDMARFMIAHADEGREIENPALKPETYRAMHTQTVSNHPGLSGIGLQFFTDTFNGERRANHGCGLPGFTTQMTFFPDSNVGFFISVVAAKKSLTYMEMLAQAITPSRIIPKDGCCLDSAIDMRKANRSFIKTVLGERSENKLHPALSKDKQHNLHDYVATYLSIRSIEGHMAEFYNTQATRSVSASKEGLMLGSKGPYVEIAPDLFQHKEHGGAKMAFLRNSAGDVTHLTFGGSSGYKKVAGFSDPDNFSLTVLTLLGLSLTSLIAIGWPKANSKERFIAYLPLANILLFMGAAALLTLGFDQSGYVTSIMDYSNVGHELRFWMIALCFNLLMINCLATIWFAYNGVKENYWGTGIRARFRQGHYGLIALACIAMLPFFISFNMIGFQLP